VSPAERAFVNRLQARARNLQPELARRLLIAYDLIRRVLSEAELARAINAGFVDSLLAEVLSDSTLDPAFSSLRALVDRSLLDSATDAARDLPSSIRSSFDVLNPRVIQAARTLDTAAIDVLKSDVRETVRQVVVEGLEAGKGARAIAARVRESVGLAPNQELWVANFRAELESGDRAALRRALGRNKLRTPDGSVLTRSGHAGGKGLGERDLALLDRVLGSDGRLRPAQVERMVTAYRKRLEAWNAEAHARTIALQAQKKATRLSWEYALERGVVQRHQLRREWLAVGGPGGDGRNRPHHLAMHGEVVGFDEQFSNGQLEPGEGDWNCRCLARVFVARMRLAA
jgi:hypothetical protein